MIILHTKGQTGNKFFTYLRYLGDSFETGEKIIVLSPDISLQHYPNIITTKLLKFPFYSNFVTNLIGYQNNIRVLNILFGNKYIIKLLKYCYSLLVFISFFRQ